MARYDRISRNVGSVYHIELMDTSGFFQFRVLSSVNNVSSLLAFIIAQRNLEIYLLKKEFSIRKVG